MVTLQTTNGQLRQTFNAFQIKPYHRKYVSSIYLKSGADLGSSLSDNFITEISRHTIRGLRIRRTEKKEIEALVKRDTRKLVSKKSLPSDANILNGRFLLARKDEGTDKEVWKALFIVQWHRDRLKNLLFTIYMLLNSIQQSCS